VFEWKNSYNIGIDSIDTEHQALFAIAAELHAALSAGQAKEALTQIVNRLVLATCSHFVHEERLMQLHHHPDYVTHKAEHDELAREVARFSTEFKNREDAFTPDLLNPLHAWLEQHMLGSDRNYSPSQFGRAVA